MTFKEREILFRGKCTDTGKWVEGSFVNIEMFSAIIDPLSYFEYGEFYAISYVDKETVGQYTGLTDKNGKKIFEGDIVKCIEITQYKEIEYISPVVFLDGSWFVHESEDCDVYLYNYETEGVESLSEIEILGNIHDNPELLEVGK